MKRVAIYIRVSTSKQDTDNQRRELEAIFTGKKGGLLAPLWGAVISSWLPTEAPRIEIGLGRFAVPARGNRRGGDTDTVEGPGRTPHTCGRCRRPGRISAS